VPPAVIINEEWWKRFSSLEQRFLMGRLLEHVINRHGAVLHNPAEQVARLMCMIALAADSALKFNLPGVSPSEADKLMKTAKKIIPWRSKVKTQIESVAQRFSQAVVEQDFNLWKKGVLHTANRAGLLVCGDLTAAFNAIIKSDPKHAGAKFDEKNPVPTWEKNEEVVELLTFAVSDPFFRLRDRMGFSIA